MNSNCSLIVFSNKAYNAIIRESFDKDPVETGGILLGHILDNGVWIVMEVLPPGINCIFERAYFEYDDTFVNYLAQSVANQYKTPLELLGLWHRHPGSMDFFSSTDDLTNATFASLNHSGAISGLVNIDPLFRLTMYHLDNPRMPDNGHHIKYSRVDIEVGDDIIPEEYFQLRYYDGDGSNLHPYVQRDTRRGQESRIQSRSVEITGNGSSNDGREQDAPVLGVEYGDEAKDSDRPTLGQRIDAAIDYFRSHRYIIVIILLVIFGLSIKFAWNSIQDIPNYFKKQFKPKIEIKILNDAKSNMIESEPNLPEESANNTAIEEVVQTDAESVEDKEKAEPTQTLAIENGQYSESCLLNKGQIYKFGLKLTGINESEIVWESSDCAIVKILEDHKIKGLKKGKATIYAKYKDLSDSIKVTVK